MNRYRTILGLATLSFLAMACDSGGHKKAVAPPAIQYGVSIVAVDAVNKDTGQTLTVQGLPVTGGTLNVNPDP